MTKSYKKINFVYFDVGGVAILDFSKTSKWNEMLADLNLRNEQRKIFEDLFDEKEFDLCKGLLDLPSICNKAKTYGLEFPENYSMLNDFINRFERNNEIEKVIKKVQSKFKVGLLTNMYPEMLDLIRVNKLLPEIKWDVIVDSSVEGCAKPEDKIFEIAEAKAQVKRNEILFIDNTQRHLDAAGKRGWKTLLYDPSEIRISNNLILETLNIE